MAAKDWRCFHDSSIYLGARRLPIAVPKSCRGRDAPPDVLCWLAAVIACLPSFAFAVTPKDVARIVSEDEANQRFTDEMPIGKTFQKLEIPILAGSSVLPALTLVEWPVYDEHPPECPPWEPWSMEESMRLEKLKVGPGREMTDLEWSSRSNNVRMVVWPSGHVLWTVDQGKRQVLRNRKGELVEYRFVKIDFTTVIKRIEKCISSENRPRGYYRKAVLLDSKESGEAIRHHLVVVGKEYIFKSVTHVTEPENEPLYKQSKWQFSVDRPWDDVRQFVAICGAVQDALPLEGGYDTLRSEPNYAWIGKRDLWEEPGFTDPIPDR